MSARVLGQSAWWLALAVSSTIACAPATSRPVVAPLDDVASYRGARARLVADERALRLGAGLVLSADEQAADRRLRKLQADELARTRASFPPAASFLLARTRLAYEQSPLFAVLRRMPKGAVLHGHLSAMGDYRWMVQRVMASDRTYVFMDDDQVTPRGALRFADATPGAGWRRLSELRIDGENPSVLEQRVLRALTLGDEEITHADIWSEFTTIFGRVRGLFSDSGFSADHFDHVVENLVHDNVQYLELRSAPVDEAWIARARRHDPAFDVKFIPAAGRSISRDEAARVLADVVDERQAHPDRVKGFDLVQEEDEGNTNIYYLEELLAARRAARQRGMDLPLYLHSGESNWADNDNLYDAILLGAPRIGHALALIRHPLLLQQIKVRDIAIEVCPISNQVLAFVSDLRTHPAAHYLSVSVPLVLSSDDPGIFQSSLTHDFYAAFMAWGLDLRALKQLAMNSLHYSAMTAEERSRAMTVWQQRWTSFVTWVNGTYPDA
jgi:adenosine deaminase CECR1